MVGDSGRKRITVNLDSHHSNEIVEWVRHIRPSHFSFKIQSYLLLVDNGLTRYESGVFEAGGYSWRLVFYPLGNNKTTGSSHISLYLKLANSDTLPLGWEVNVCFKLFVQDQIRDKYLTIQGDARRFYAMNDEWGFPDFLSMDTFKDASKGYLVNDSCVLEIENFAERKEVLESETFKVGGSSWKLMIYPKGDIHGKDHHLSFFLSLVDGQNRPRKGRVYAKCKLRVKDQLWSKHHENEVSQWFECDSLNKSWGFSEFILLNDLKNASKGYIQKDTLIAEAQFTLVSATAVNCHSVK